MKVRFEVWSNGRKVRVAMGRVRKGAGGIEYVRFDGREFQLFDGCRISLEIDPNFGDRVQVLGCEGR